MPFLMLLLVLGSQTSLAASRQRFFESTPQYELAGALSDSLLLVVDSVDVVVKDAFDGAESHSEAEDLAYGLLNKIHIESRAYVIRRRLLFRVGDTVNAARLRETEKNLRSEEFLADAYIEVKTEKSDSGQTRAVIKVTTFDQWTLAVSPNGYITGGQLVWWLGLVESNILGHGQRLAFFISHGLERNSQYLDYANTYFTPLRLSLAGNMTWASDGYSYSMSMGKPLRSREQKWGFNVSTSGSRLNEYQYLSGNVLEAGDAKGLIPDSLTSRFRKTNYYGHWDDVGTFTTNVSVTRAFGYRTKTSLTPFYTHYEKFQGGNFYKRSLLLREALSLDEEPDLYTRHNEQLGLTASIYQYDFKTVNNFRNLKWSETVDVGWKLTTTLAQNQEWLGSDQDDWYLSQSGVFNNTWFDRLFVNSSASVGSYLNADGDWVDGSVSANLESQFKPIWWTSTLLSGAYAHLFATAESRQYTLGEDSGLNGYPNFFYAGQARALFAAEQRFFSTFEFATVVPAFAVYLNAGNAWDTYEQVDLNDLHYSVGFGLRLGLTRSVQKIVNHVNLTFPLGNEHLPGWTFSVRATKGL
jgi:hypothetical protein